MRINHTLNKNCIVVISVVVLITIITDISINTRGWISLSSGSSRRLGFWLIVLLVLLIICSSLSTTTLESCQRFISLFLLILL